MAKNEVQLRIRCPVCGMVSWQNTLNAHHEFELLYQQKIGWRKWKWLRQIDPKGKAARELKVLLALRLRQIADRLEREATVAELGARGFEKMVPSASIMSASLSNPKETVSWSLPMTPRNAPVMRATVPFSMHSPNAS
jgi:DNA-directed RNA polymerase specialized sigma54-like protein